MRCVGRRTCARAATGLPFPDLPLTRPLLESWARLVLSRVGWKSGSGRLSQTRKAHELHRRSHCSSPPPTPPPPHTNPTALRPPYACRLPLTTSSAVRLSARAKAWGFVSRHSFALPSLRAAVRVHACHLSARLVLHARSFPPCTRSKTSPARPAMAGRRRCPRWASACRGHISRTACPSHPRR